MSEKQLIEINGVKMEVDHRTAKISKVDTFKVGDPVKLLLKVYSGHEVKPGLIVSFDQFTKRPTITIAYLEYGEMKFVQVYDGCEHEFIATTPADLDINKEYILERMQREIDKQEHALKDLQAKKKFFIDQFGQYLKENPEGVKAI